MNDLVRRLCENHNPVEVIIRPERTAAALKKALERGYVHVRFSETKGGTEIGVRVDSDLTDLTGANFEGPEGVIKLVGTLVLDYVPVRCTARIDLKTLMGDGQLEVLESAESLQNTAASA